MLNLVSTNKKLGLTVAAAVLALMSLDSSAQIYKWRDHRGVTQYSDKPPATSVVAGFVQATRNEVVNALQKKDVCTLDTPAKKTLPTQKLAANFFVTSPTNNFLNNQINDNGLAGLGKFAIGALSKPKPAVAQYSPFSNTASTIYRAGRNNVTVFGAPNNPFQNKLAAQAGPKSLPTGGTMVAANAPVAAPKNMGTRADSPAPNSTTTTAPSSTNTAAPTVTANANPNTATPAGTQTPPSNIVQVGLMPAVDISKNMLHETGFDSMRIKAGNPAVDVFSSDNDGAFRIACNPSHMSNDDPIVYPNQPGAAHHHIFFGNTSTDAKTNVAALAGTGNSTCMGGTANRSAYWMPSIIDTATNTPLVPFFSLTYYKTGAVVPSQYITAPPKGLRMIAGNSKSSTSQRVNSWTNPVTYNCTDDVSPTAVTTDSIPECPAGKIVSIHIDFPQCWDGLNLDSPDHKSHMAYAVNGISVNNCPASHPVAIPRIAMNLRYRVTEGTQNWRLSSDNYTKNGYNAGFSGHADWINGWDEKVMAGIVKNCLNKGMNCGSHMLGDGNIIY